MTVTRNLHVVEDLPETMLRVAFATSDCEEVDQHFGSASAIAIYAIDATNAYPLQISEFGDLNQDGNEDKLLEKFDLLDGCIAVYCRACGSSAARQLMARGIQPVKVTDGALIRSLIEGFQQELRDGPSSWLARALRKHNPDARSRFDEMEAEGWSE